MPSRMRYNNYRGICNPTWGIRTSFFFLLEFFFFFRHLFVLMLFRFWKMIAFSFCRVVDWYFLICLVSCELWHYDDDSSILRRLPKWINFLLVACDLILYLFFRPAFSGFQSDIATMWLDWVGEARNVENSREM